MKLLLICRSWIAKCYNETAYSVCTGGVKCIEIIAEHISCYGLHPLPVVIILHKKPKNVY